MTDQPEFDAIEAQRVALIREAARIAERLDGPELLAYAMKFCHSQAEVARVSGITENTLTALKQGKRPSPAQRAALMWGIARTMGL